MSQSVFADMNPATTSGTQLASILVDFKDALMSGLCGDTRPSELQAGGFWIDQSNEDPGDGGFWAFQLYDGTNDIEIFRIDLASGTTTLAGTNNSFDILKVSADTVGPILSLTKRRIASSGQVASGDEIGVIKFIGRDNSGGDPVSVRLRAIASNTMTSSIQGGYLVVEAISVGTNTISEIARFKDGKFAVGLNTPDSAVHVRSTTGIKTDRLADDAVGAKVLFKKARVSGTGATQNNDVIAEIDFISTDDATADATTASIVVSATQAHTASAQGTKISFKVAKTGAATQTSQFEIGDTVEAIALLKVNAYQLVSQDVATSASVTALSSSKSIVNFTGSTATAVHGLDSTGLGKTVLIHNGSSAVVTLKHQSSTDGTAANRLKLPLAADVAIQPDSSVELFYHTGDTRWKMKSGSGGGSIQSFGTLASARTIVAATGLTEASGHMSASGAFQTIFLQGPTAATETLVSATTQIQAGTSLGQRMTLRGTSDTQVALFDTGNGLDLQGRWGSYLGSVLLLEWDGTVWFETSRRG